LGGEELDYPKISNPDILLAMSQEASDKFLNRVKKGGLVILDSSYVTDVPSHNGVSLYFIPISDTARDRLGKE
jgi:Pyruvate ferredoxin/flavodoxin oxidoreductase.